MKTRIALSAPGMVLALTLAGCGGGGGGSPVTVPVEPTSLSLETLRDGTSVPAGTYTLAGTEADTGAIYAALVALNASEIPSEASGGFSDVGGLKVRCDDTDGCGLEIDRERRTVTITGTVEVAASDGTFPSERKPVPGTGGGSSGGGGGGSGGGGGGSGGGGTPVVSFSVATTDSEAGDEALVAVTINPASAEMFDIQYTLGEETVTVSIDEERTSFNFPVDISGRAVGETLNLVLVDGDDYDLGTARNELALRIRNVSIGTPPPVGIGGVGGYQSDNVMQALGGTPLVGSAPSIGDTNQRVSTSSWGVWIQGTDLYVWHGPPGNIYEHGVFNLPSEGSATEGSATYEGSVAGIGYHGPSESRKSGRFDADIELTAVFSDGLITGNVSNFRGTGAGSSWGTVTLGDSGSVSDGGTTGGSWEHSYYRKENATGNPDGVTGYVDLTFSEEEAVGAFHAPRKP